MTLVEAFSESADSDYALWCQDMARRLHTSVDLLLPETQPWQEHPGSDQLVALGPG